MPYQTTNQQSYSNQNTISIIIVQLLNKQTTKHKILQRQNGFNEMLSIKEIKEMTRDWQQVSSWVKKHRCNGEMLLTVVEIVGSG